MGTARAGLLLQHVRKLATDPGGPGEPDGQLLQRFVQERDEAAFTALVQRHAAMVLNVCRCALRHEQDAEDCFQATFLVLARKAASIRNRQSVGGWLHEVAYHVALKARARSARPLPDGRPESTSAGDPVLDLTLRDLQRVLHEELRRLPEKFRAPLVLCYLEARTQDEAARQLGCSEAALRGRLHRGRKRLRARLTRRGLTLGAGLFPAMLSQNVAAAAVPAPLLRAALATATGPGAASVPARVAELSAAALRSAALTRVRVGAVVLLTLALASATAGILAGGLLPVTPQDEPARARPQPPREPEGPPADANGDPLPPGAIARLGTERFRQGRNIGSMALSPDGKVLATCGRIDFADVYLWDAKTGKVLRSLPEGRRMVHAVAFSPDGRVVATGSAEGEVRRWEVDTGKELAPLKAPGIAGPGTLACALAFTPDGKTLAAVFQAKLIRLFDVATGKLLPQFQGEYGHTNLMAFSPDGKILAVAGYDHDKSYYFTLWDAATGKELHRLKGHRGGIYGVAFSPDGKTVASGARGDPTVRLWDVGTGAEVRQLKAPDETTVLSLAFTPDGTQLVVGGGAIRVWDLKQGKVVRQIPHAPRHLALFPDGKAVATSDGASMRVWDLTTGRDRHALGGPENALKAVAWSPDNRTVATWSWNGDVFLWDVVTGKTLYRFDVPAHRNVAFSPDGKLLAGATGGRLCVWDTATGKEVGPFKAHPSQPHHVAFTPDGKALVTMDFDDESVRRWDLATGQERLLFHLTPPDKKVRRHRFTTMAFSPEARLMALAEDRLDRTTALFGECDVYVYDVTTGKQLHRLKKHKNQLWALAFAPDGRVLVTAGRRFGGEGIILWDTATGKVIGSLPDGVDYGLAFSRDGRSFAAATRGTPICVWETATLRERCRFGGHPREGIYALAFAPDGRALISAGGDTTALVWDLTGLRRGQRLPALRLTPGEVEALWNDLQGDDAARAWRAIWKLAAAPADSLPALRKHLRPVPLPDAGKLARWIEELGSAKFAVRQRASQEFEKLGEVATPALRKALAGQVPEETRRRIEQLLARVENPAGGPGVLRMLRALEAVEHGGTDEARQFLRALAEGAPGARLTREARAALERLRP